MRDGCSVVVAAGLVVETVAAAAVGFAFVRITFPVESVSMRTGVDEVVGVLDVVRVGTRTRAVPAAVVLTGATAAAAAVVRVAGATVVPAVEPIAACDVGLTGTVAVAAGRAVCVSVPPMGAVALAAGTAT